LRPGVITRLETNFTLSPTSMTKCLADPESIVSCWCLNHASS
jgi:hypothetical protein